ncbi:FkbM family methyltransferase [Desulfovibrio desulfuricans]|uniref:FkbM family methyltransferase n=1 Tax=Desulfovibrio desulfuricans TaxID=876 RepID=UPI0039843FDA
MKKLLKKICSRLGIRASIPYHPNAVSKPESMIPIADQIKTYTTLAPRNIFEIGANYAQDAAGLSRYFNVTAENVWVFEPHPQIFKEIEKLYRFKAFNVAVFNDSLIAEFNMVDMDLLKAANNNSVNLGMSGLMNREDIVGVMKKVPTQTIRMDEFMDQHQIENIDFLKLDVEGATFEALEGFGLRLKDVKAMQLEAEHIQVWENQKLYGDIERLLTEHGFSLLNFQRKSQQSDSIWVQEEYIKID